MKIHLCLALLLAATACSKPAQPAIHDVAANRMGNEDDVTDVPDESADDNAGSGNNSVDPD